MPPLAKTVFCNFPFKRLKITETGETKHCCFQPEFLGNVLETSPEELWRGSLSQAIRQDIERGKLHQSCQGEACPFMHNKNLSHFSTPVPAQDPEYPVCLEIDLPSTHCNIGGVNPTPQTACMMCPRAASTFASSGDNTDKIIERIKHITPHIRALHVSGIAEPFWKDKIFDVLSKMGFQDYRHQIHVLAYTNVTLFTPEVQKRWIDTVDLSYLSFSLDAATPETFEKIRRVKMYDKILDHIRHYVKTKPEAHGCGIYNNLNTVNIHEASQMVETAADLGINFIGLTLTVTCNGWVENVTDKVLSKDNESLFADAEAKARETAKRLGVNLFVQRPFRITNETKDGRISLL